MSTLSHTDPKTPFEGRHHYLPASDELMSLGVYLTGCGACTVPPGSPYPAKGHPSLYDFKWHEGRILPEFQILIITQGSGVFESKALGEHPVGNGDVLFLFPGIWHRYRPHTETGWTERWISMNGDQMHRLYDAGVISEQRAVHTARNPEQLAKEFDALIQDIDHRPSQNSILRSLNVTGMIATVLAACGEGDRPPSSPSIARRIDDPLVARIVDAIWSHSHRQFSIDDLLAPLEVSRRTAERHVRSALGHGMLDEIARCRLSRAKRLLLETRLPVKAITHLAGFSSEERMRVTFQQKEGCSPGAYRERH